MARDIRVSIDLNEEKVRECAEEAITGEVRRILDEEFTETLKNMIRPAVESRLRKFFDFRGELNRNQTIDDLIRKQIAEIAAAKGFDKRLAELVDQYCQQYIRRYSVQQGQKLLRGLFQEHPCRQENGKESQVMH